MNLSSIREDVIKEFIAQELLDDGVFPTIALVCAIALRDYKDTEVFKSFLTDSLFINNEDPARATLFNDTSKKASIDIATLYRFIDFLLTRISDQQAVLRQKLHQMTVIIKQLIDKSNGLLLLNEDTVALHDIFTEDFSSLANINMAETTALVNTGEQNVTVRHASASDLHISELIDSSSISCATARYISIINPIGHSLSKLYDTAEDTISITEIEMPSDHIGNVEFWIKIKFKEQLSFNNLVFKMKEGSSAGGYEASLDALVGESWKTIQEFDSYTSKIDMSFDPITSKEIIIKILVGDYGNIGSSLVYTLFGKDIQINWVDASVTEIMQLNPITFNAPFSVIGLRDDSVIPDNCTIDYFASWKIQSTWSDFVQIDSVNYTNVLAEEVQQFSQYTIDLTYLHPYNAGSNNCLSYSSVSVPLWDIHKSKLLRNLNKFNTNDPQILSCVLNVKETTYLDFSIIPGYLNGDYVDTALDVPKGIHRFHFTEKLAQDVYILYLQSKNVTFGSYLADYISPEVFANIAENDNYSVYTILLVNDSGGSPVYTIMIKNINEDEITELISYTPVSTNIADELIIKAELTGFDQNKPILNSIKIKVG